jgi:hypothetical protein
MNFRTSCDVIHNVYNDYLILLLFYFLLYTYTPMKDRENVFDVGNGLACDQKRKS